MFWKTGCNCLPGCMGKAARKHREGFVMTETKYIFPKQPQSMAVLAFIAVLIILLLVLIVMVHMRNIFLHKREFSKCSESAVYLSKIYHHLLKK